MQAHIYVATEYVHQTPVRMHSIYTTLDVHRASKHVGLLYTKTIDWQHMHTYTHTFLLHVLLVCFLSCVRILPSGAGVDITWQRSIPLLNAVLSSFVSATSDPQSPGALLRFAHAETLVPLTAFLGLFLDKQPLTASNYNGRY